ncbi:MAG: hypothetical protein MUP55_00010 [Candidatus Aenigmarchaeota archaeon]|nr:hypothetical protein [Candidatus Aenigmarchaeota archaeon]
MAYAKFVTKTNKEGKQINYGPYYYKSIRTPDGKVRNIYLGTEPSNGKTRRIMDMLAGLRRL